MKERIQRIRTGIQKLLPGAIPSGHFASFLGRRTLSFADETHYKQIHVSAGAVPEFLKGIIKAREIQKKLQK